MGEQVELRAVLDEVENTAWSGNIADFNDLCDRLRALPRPTQGGAVEVVKADRDHAKSQMEASQCDGDMASAEYWDGRYTALARLLPKLRALPSQPDLREALGNLSNRAESFWAFLQGEYGVRLSSEDQDDHNVYDFFNAIARARAALAESEKPPLCEECGMYPADPPRNLCPGCDAYRDHTGAI